VPESLSVLTNDELARLILRQLWQFHDAGGVSMGRSLRNVLLEAAIHMMPMPEMRNPDASNIPELFEEAAKRKRIIPRRMKTAPRLKQISNRTLAILALHELRAWYQADAEKNPHMPLTFEWRVADLAVGLLPLPRGFKKPASWSLEDVVEEARERYRRHIRREMEQQLQM
jgi:hypothetical protein